MDAARWKTRRNLFRLRLTRFRNEYKVARERSRERRRNWKKEIFTPKLVHQPASCRIVRPKLGYLLLCARARAGIISQRHFNRDLAELSSLLPPRISWPALPRSCSRGERPGRKIPGRRPWPLPSRQMHAVNIKKGKRKPASLSLSKLLRQICFLPLPPTSLRRCFAFQFIPR